LRTRTILPPARHRQKSTAFALFGQDWTPFGSSTVPNTIETNLRSEFATIFTF